MIRAEALVAVMESVEERVMSESVTRLVQPEEVKAIIDEAVRGGVEALLRAESDAGPRSADEADATLARIEAAIGEMRQAMRLRDYAAAHDPALDAAHSLGMDVEAATSPAAQRGVLGALIALAEVERAVEGGATVEEATRAIRAERFDGAPADRLPKPVMLSAAVKQSIDKAVSNGMANKQRGTGRLLTAFHGDVPVDQVFSPARLVAWMLWLRRVPRNWANAHGKNRYNDVAREICLQTLVCEADAQDAALRAELEAKDDLSLREKRRIFASRAVKRMDDKTVGDHHGRAKAIHDAARALGWGAGPWCSVMKDWERDAARETNRSQDPFAMHVTLGKSRVAWSDERIARLLTSSIFTGCFSKDRRWRPGRFVIRDALYWVPLLVLTCGLRPEEALKLTRADVQHRDGVICLQISYTVDGRLKNKSSIRYVPVPAILLQLGFLEWWRERPENGDEALFPEVPASKHSQRISDIFGKRLGRVFAHLGLHDLDEDFYALRHTFITRLQLTGAPDGVRQAIVGHEQDTIINVHYTAANLRLFRNYMDRVNYRLTIAHNSAADLPVIVGCDLTEGHAIDVAVALTPTGAIRKIVVRDPIVGDLPVISLTLRGADGKTLAGKADLTDRAARKLFRMLKGRRIVMRDADEAVDDQASAESAIGGFIARGAAAARMTSAGRSVTAA